MHKIFIHSVGIIHHLFLFDRLKKSLRGIQFDAIDMIKEKSLQELNTISRLRYQNLVSKIGLNVDMCALPPMENTLNKINID